MSRIIDTTVKKSDRSVGNTAAILFSVLSAVMVISLTFSVWYQFKQQEHKLTHNQLRERLVVISNDIQNQVDNSALSLRRMANRWGVRKGIPQAEWAKDAQIHVQDFDALTTVEWIDSTYHVRWIEPLEGNEAAQGLNIVFNAERKEALDGAAEQGKTTLTPPFDMVQGYRAFISYAPIYVDGQFDGFIAGIYDTKIFINTVLENNNIHMLNVHITDGENTVFRSTQSDFSSSFTHSMPVTLFNRDWVISVSATMAFLKQERTYLAELSLFGGIILSLLVAFFVYTAIVSKKRSIMLLDKTDKLNQANAELEEFAYRVSHDLRSPLVSSLGLIGLAQQSIKADQSDVACKSLDHSQDSLSRLVTLIEDILSLTQIKNQEEPDTEVDIAEIIAVALDKFSHMDNFDRLEIKCDLQHSEPIKLKRSRITLIIENLISNSIKYQDLEETHSYIHIKTKDECGNFMLSVEDNGLGIPKAQHGQIFAMFKRFHTKASFGSGLGLYMMKKSADILGGTLVFEAPEKGALFRLSVPSQN